MLTPDAYVVHVGEPAAHARPLGRRDRCATPDSPIVAQRGGGSFKSQMKRADASGARYALIVGDDEVAANRVGLKPLRAAGEQIALAPVDLAARLRAAH